MTHYGLLDTTQMTEEKAALMLARLHLLGGKRQLQEVLSVAGLVFLYNALLFGMHYFIAGSACSETFKISSDDLWDHAALYHKLVKIGVFDDPNAFNRLSLIIERALWQKSFPFNADAVLAEVEMMLTNLGIMPFNETGFSREVGGVF